MFQQVHQSCFFNKFYNYFHINKYRMPAKKTRKQRKPRVARRMAAASKEKNKNIQKVNVNVQSSGGGGGSGSAVPIPQQFRDTSGESRVYEGLLAAVKKSAENVREDVSKMLEGAKAADKLKRDEEMENQAMKKFNAPKKVFEAPIKNTESLMETVKKAEPAAVPMAEVAAAEKAKRPYMRKEQKLQQAIESGNTEAAAKLQKQIDEEKASKERIASAAKGIVWRGTAGYEAATQEAARANQALSESESEKPFQYRSGNSWVKTSDQSFVTPSRSAYGLL